MIMSKLTLSDAVALADIIRAAQSNAPVAYSNDDGATVVFGQARSVGDERGNFARDDDDVTDLYLRVTTAQGWEAFWPLREIIDAHKVGLFVPDYQAP
jgi:hypothetical protein